MIGVALYGSNGHQVQGKLAAHPRARLAGVAALAREALPPPLRDDPAVRVYANLDELLADDRVQLVSLCSPRRADQAADAIRCLKAGRHVYAEKPCALSERDLDAILAAAAASGRTFREMAGSAFGQPYRAMRELVARGEIGTVVQVLAQKSYPYHERRPADEAIDGGLFLQAGVHGARFIEQVGGSRIATITALETRLGCETHGDLRRASCAQMTLENGALASLVANYLKPGGFPSHGNEMLRVFGTRGFVESTDAGTRTRLVLNERDAGTLEIREPGLDWFDALLGAIDGVAPMPISVEDEIHPTRMLLRAKEALGRTPRG